MYTKLNNIAGSMSAEAFNACSPTLVNSCQRLLFVSYKSAYYKYLHVYTVFFCDLVTVKYVPQDVWWGVCVLLTQHFDSVPVTLVSTAALWTEPQCPSNQAVDQAQDAEGYQEVQVGENHHG